MPNNYEGEYERWIKASGETSMKASVNAFLHAVPGQHDSINRGRDLEDAPPALESILRFV